MAITSKRFTPCTVCPLSAGRAPGVEAQTRSAFASSRRPSEQLECSIFRSGASPLVSLSNAGADTQSFASVSWSISMCGSAKMSEDLSAVRSSRFRALPADRLEISPNVLAAQRFLCKPVCATACLNSTCARDNHVEALSVSPPTRNKGRVASEASRCSNADRMLDQG